MGSRRAPIIASAAVLALAVIMVFFLVLPKMNDVTQAQAELETVQAEGSALESQKAALEDAQKNSAEYEATIAAVEAKIPPTIEVPGVILLLDNAATASSLNLTTFTPGTPALDETTGLSTLDIAVSVQGTYFSLDQFLYKIETLPRAAQVLNVGISPATDTGSSALELIMSATVRVYTSDQSAGPGSEPGPTSGSGAG